MSLLKNGLKGIETEESLEFGEGLRMLGGPGVVPSVWDNGAQFPPLTFRAAGQSRGGALFSPLAVVTMSLGNTLPHVEESAGRDWTKRVFRILGHFSLVGRKSPQSHWTPLSSV